MASTARPEPLGHRAILVEQLAQPVDLGQPDRKEQQGRKALRVLELRARPELKEPLDPKAQPAQLVQLGSAQPAQPALLVQPAMRARQGPLVPQD
jgi:hypothetical protein